MGQIAMSTEMSFDIMYEIIKFPRVILKIIWLKTLLPPQTTRFIVYRYI